MVVGVRKNMLLFENKLSYIFCVVGAGVTNAEWASWFVSTSAVGWHVHLCTCAWYLTMCFVKFESTVVKFDSGVVGLEINVWYCFRKCEKSVFVPLLKFSATRQTFSLRHPTHAATSDPLVAQCLWNTKFSRPGWQVPGQVALSGNRSVNCKHCAKYPWLCSVIKKI